MPGRYVLGPPWPVVCLLVSVRPVKSEERLRAGGTGEGGGAKPRQINQSWIAQKFNKASHYRSPKTNNHHHSPSLCSRSLLSAINSPPTSSTAALPSANPFIHAPVTVSGPSPPSDARIAVPPAFKRPVGIQPPNPSSRRIHHGHPGRSCRRARHEHPLRAVQAGSAGYVQTRQGPRGGVNEANTIICRRVGSRKGITVTA